MVTPVIDLTDVREALGKLVDPEIPVLTLDDLGVLRSVSVEEGTVLVTITPTYSGCPAMRQIEDDITGVLLNCGIDDFRVETVLAPAWTTDWISEVGHRKLAEFGIAPPTSLEAVLCPRCASDRPTMLAQFGSTACKALMVCSHCGEPFDYFKQH